MSTDRTLNASSRIKPPRRVVPLPDRAYHHIRRKLFSGDFEPGRGLSVRTLAGELGMSTMPVREAIYRLRTENLIEQRHGSGTYPRTITRADLVNMLELRELIEGNAVRRVVERVTPDGLDKLRRPCHGMRLLLERAREDEWDQWSDELTDQVLQLDEPFHRELLHIAGNPMAARIVEDLRLMTRLIQVWEDPVLDVAEEMDRIYRNHVVIVEAVARHDADAAQAAMVGHVRSTGGQLLNLFDRKGNRSS